LQYFLAGVAVGLVLGTSLGIVVMAALVAASRRPPL